MLSFKGSNGTVFDNDGDKTFIIYNLCNAAYVCLHEYY